MKTLQEQPEFAAWYASSGGWLKKKELLSRRLRADLDPVSVHFHGFLIHDVAQLLNRPQFVNIANFAAEQKSDRQSAAALSSEHQEETGAVSAPLTKERACVPESELLAGFKDMLLEARGDAFMVSIARSNYVIVYTFVRFLTATRH